MKLRNMFGYRRQGPDHFGWFFGVRWSWCPDFGSQHYEKRWQDRVFPGHVSLGPATLFGANAMHWTLVIRAFDRDLMIHPTTYTFGKKWPWFVRLDGPKTIGAGEYKRLGIGPGFYA